MEFVWNQEENQELYNIRHSWVNPAACQYDPTGENRFEPRDRCLLTLQEDYRYR